MPQSRRSTLRLTRASVASVGWSGQLGSIDQYSRIGVAGSRTRVSAIDRAAAVMSLIQSAMLNGHDPYRDLTDVLARLPTQPNSRIDELLPHHWSAAAATA